MGRKAGILVLAGASLALVPLLASALERGTKPFAVAVDQPAVQTLNPERRDGIIRNPGIGYQTFYQSAATDGQLPSSTMYVRFYWSGIERTVGGFDFTLIDRALSQARAAGQRLAFRIMPYDNGEGGPLALRKAGLRGFAFTFEGTEVWAPDFDDEMVRQDLGKLISALGGRYGANAAIDSIDLGLIGDWGEQHFWHTNPTPPYPSSGALKWLSDEFRARFNVPVLVNDGIWENNPEAFRYATDNGLGWRVDCWGGAREMSWKYPRLLRDVSTAWQSSPVILEPCGVMRDWLAGAYPWRKSLQWAVDNHVSQISNKSAPIPGEMMEDVKIMLAKLGYRFALRRASFPIVAKIGQAFHVELDWANEGNAPMYFPRHVLLKLGPRITESDVSMQGFGPGMRTDVVSVETRGVAAGSYPLEIGLAPPTTTQPDITLAIQGEGPWYSLGNVTLKD